MVASEFSTLFASFSNKKVLIVGDIMIDSYLRGKVERISPEAPVPILSNVSAEDRLGGAANVAINIKALGANPILCSVIGADENSDKLISLLEKQNLETRGIIQSEGRKTTIKTRVISGGQHILRIDDEITKPLDKVNQDILLLLVKELALQEEVHAIVFEDYDKGVLSEQVISDIITWANNMEIKTLVDPKKQNFMHYKGVSLFKPNFIEFVQGCKLDINKSDTEELKKHALAFQNKQDIDILLITLSELGVFVSKKNGEQHIFAAEVRNISDVSGAGDTVISVATLCLADEQDIKDIALISNMAGGLVCEQSGVVPIDKAELLLECKSKLAHN